MAEKSAQEHQIICNAMLEEAAAENDLPIDAFWVDIVRDYGDVEIKDREIRNEFWRGYGLDPR